MKRRVVLAVAVALTLALALVWTQWLVPMRNAVAIGTAMLAKQMCSCVFVAGRPQADCRADQFASMDAITVEVARDAHVVRAFVPGLGERSASYEEGYGCTLR